jgi:multidrug efflux system outer membrane protein
MRVRFAFVVGTLLTGCMVGPNYQRPEVQAPASFRFEVPNPADTANIAWWEQFQDPVLNALIESALKNNKDVRIAAARIDEFAGRFGTTRSQLFPQIGYQGSVGRDQLSETTGTPLPPGVENPETTYLAIATAGWEIDIWGRVRRLSESARADLLASVEGRRAIILTLVSAVATGYVGLRDLDKQLEIAQSTAKSYQETVQLFEMRFKGGVVSEVELVQVRSQYEQAAARIPQFEKLIAQQENALSVLLGRNPGPIPRGRPLDELVLPAVPEGLPSQLLEQRPDILEAEQRLIAENALIGAARARYYPSISLTGFLGGTSAELSDLFDSPSKTWNFTGGILGPIFTGGAIKGQILQAEARQRQTLLAYERVIQNAFREVDDALIDHQKSRAQLAAQTRQVEALRDYARLAWLRFNNGYTSYLEVLDARRSLFDAELERSLTQGVVFQALVSVYKAMGGGWVTAAEKVAGAVDPLAEKTDVHSTQGTPTKAH